MTTVEYTPVERLRQCGQECLGLSGVVDVTTRGEPTHFVVVARATE